MGEEKATLEIEADADPESGYLAADWQEQVAMYGKVMEKCVEEARRIVPKARMPGVDRPAFVAADASLRAQASLAIYNSVTRYASERRLSGMFEQLMEEQRTRKPIAVPAALPGPYVVPPTPDACDHNYLRPLARPGDWPECIIKIAEALISRENAVECPDCGAVFPVEDVKAGRIWEKTEKGAEPRGPEAS